MTYGLLVACILAANILSNRIMHAVAALGRGSTFLVRLFFFPGIVIHELSHAVACFFTGTPIHEVSFWDETGGHVMHAKPRFAPLVQPLISFAPFPVGLGLLYFLSHYITLDQWQLSLFAGLLMISIAATLAPSKADFIPALEGIFIFAIIAGVTWYYMPGFFDDLVPAISKFNDRFLIINGILAAIWIGLLILRSISTLPRRHA